MLSFRQTESGFFSHNTEIPRLKLTKKQEPYSFSLVSLGCDLQILLSREAIRNATMLSLVRIVLRASHKT